jgi:hypothetical protein
VTATRGRRKASSRHGQRRGGTRKHWSLQNSIINTAIVILSLLVVAFIFSFSRQYTQSGIPIEVSFPAEPEPARLAVEIYEQNPILDIEVEVLNGCGEAGLASRVSDFLRTNRIDVVRAENADHFAYTQTLLIQRNENVEALQKVAATLGFNPEDKRHVLIQPDAASDVDLTLIIGQDYRTIPPLNKFLARQF